jgi:cytochrome c-type biogenesis protein
MDATEISSATLLSIAGAAFAETDGSPEAVAAGISDRLGANKLAGAFALGVPFTVAICPFCTPALVVLLGVVATTGSPLIGVLLLLAFALGRAVPIALGAWALGWLENLKPLAAYQRAFDIGGGITLIVAGLYMLNAYFIWVPELAV